MNIICHRGFWKKLFEQNSIDSLKKAINSNFGVEFDVREYKSKLVISHDIPNDHSPSLNKFLHFYHLKNKNLYLAINIKTDGISDILLKSLNKYKINKYFVFDMSAPEQILYWKKKIKFFSRFSDLESSPILYNQSQGLWIDNFNIKKFNYKLVNDCVRKNKKICFVSPEIHKRNYSDFWKYIKKYNNYKNSFLCTDLFLKADIFFNDKNAK